jgi:flavin reductase (DIM6/NTAB) family NADH-FMN oxidoreductase RutF
MSSSDRFVVGSTVLPGEFRAAMALLATGVTVISTLDPATGGPTGMTANAVMSVSLAPPLIVVSVRRQARMHALLERVGAYGVTVLGDHQEAEARRFAGLAADEGHTPRFASRHGVPVLRDGMAWVVARVAAALRAGDHTLFLGEVLAVGADRPNDPPLAFHRSRFARLVPAPAQPGAAWDAFGVWG